MLYNAYSNEKRKRIIGRYGSGHSFLAHVRFDMAFTIPHPLFTFLNMKMKLFYTYILLIALTLTGALLAGLPITKAIVIAIVFFSVLKYK